MSRIVTRRLPEDARAQSWPISGLAPTFDVAISQDGSRVAVVGLVGPTRDGSHAVGGVLHRFSLDALQTVVLESCAPSGSIEFPSEPTAVVFDGNDRVWVQTREPAQLLAFEAGEHDESATIVLSNDSVADSGHALFHYPTVGLVACVSCHPEGREDGRVWAFEGQPARRTQALDIGLHDGAPFHWNGDMPDIAAIDREIRVHRMGGGELSPAYADALERWLFALPRETAPTSDPDVIARGQQHYEAVGCVPCHGGPDSPHDLTVVLEGGGPVQVPTLRGVAFRAPYMHDGRAADLRAAVQEMLDLSHPGGELTDAELDDLVAYVASR